MRYIEAGRSSGHIAVILGRFDRQSEGINLAVNPSAMVTKTISSVRNKLTSKYGLSEAVLNGVSPICGAEKLWMDYKFLGTDIRTNEGMSGTYCSVWRLEAFNPQKGVCIDNSPKGTHGYNVKYLLEPVTPELPQITSANISEVSEKGYTVTVQINAEAGIKSVMMPTWTEDNGQDDLIWHEAQVTGNTAKCYIEAADHGGSTLKYITHIYVTDYDGRSVMKQVDTYLVETQEPAVSDIIINGVTNEGFSVKANVYAEAGIDKVKAAVWSSQNGQDDIKWYNMSIEGSNASVYVPFSDHNNEQDLYYVHIYLYDTLDRYAFSGLEKDVYYKDGLVLEDTSWNYYSNGSFGADYTGLVFYNEGWFYVENGSINWDYTGEVTFEGNVYNVVNGVY